MTVSKSAGVCKAADCDSALVGHGDYAGDCCDRVLTQLAFHLKHRREQMKD